MEIRGTQEVMLAMVDLAVQVNKVREVQWDLQEMVLVWDLPELREIRAYLLGVELMVRKVRRVSRVEVMVIKE
jgi:hypothetical protein